MRKTAKLLVDNKVCSIKKKVYEYKKKEKVERNMRKKAEKKWASPSLTVQNYFYSNISNFLCICY